MFLFETQNTKAQSHQDVFQINRKTTMAGKAIVDSAITVHKELGPRLLESIYVKCFCLELISRNISFELHKSVPVNYKNNVLENALFIDVLVENCIVVEFKSQDFFYPVWEAQVLSYLKLAKKRLGFILNLSCNLNERWD